MFRKEVDVVGRKSKQVRVPYLEFFLIFGIAFCQIIMMTITNERMESFQDIRHYNELRNSIETGEYVKAIVNDRVMDFYPNICKLVSIYNDDLELEMRLAFRYNRTEDLIHEHPDFRDLIEHHKAGYSHIIHDDGEGEDVFFVWAPDPDNDTKENLIVLRVIKPSETDVWIYNTIAYSTIFMVFALVIIMMLRRRSDSINHYYALTREKTRL